MIAYYNEHDATAAQWLRNLIAAGHIMPGVVDERDIRDITPAELEGFTQCHFFAGIGIWGHALRLAEWSDNRKIWTGSCPCQPFSAAGRGAGIADERHLWPHWFWLIEQCRPDVVLGEQVASKDGLGWLDIVSTDMENAGYAFGATDTCAAGVTVEWQDSQSGEWLERAIRDCGDPGIAADLRDFADWSGAGNIGEGGKHIRQRLYFVGLADTQLPQRWPGYFGNPANDGQKVERFESPDRFGKRGDISGLADSAGTRSLPGPLGRIHNGKEISRARDGELERRRAPERLAEPVPTGRPERRAIAGDGQIAGMRAAGRLDDDDDARPQGHAGDGGAARREGSGGPVAATGLLDGLGDSASSGHKPRPGEFRIPSKQADDQPLPERGVTGDYLRPNAPDIGREPVDWLFGRDAKWRAVRSGSFPLASKSPARVGRLRAYGNGLDARTARQFCEVVKEIIDD